jgi:hypothetical protein
MKLRRVKIRNQWQGELRIWYFGFQRLKGKALNIEISEITKSGIPKRKEKSPNDSWGLIAGFMSVNDHTGITQEGL